MIIKDMNKAFLDQGRHALGVIRALLKARPEDIGGNEYKVELASLPTIHLDIVNGNNLQGIRATVELIIPIGVTEEELAELEELHAKELANPTKRVRF